MELTPEYETLMRILSTRMSVRRFKPDPVPDEYIERVLDAGRWAMSGANSQPWEFIVIKDPETRRKIHEAYLEVNTDFSFWLEQMRYPELRHPSYQNIPGDAKQQHELVMQRRNFADAPALIVVVGDGRKQWGTVVGPFTCGRHMSHFTDSLANCCQNIHLAASALGLGSQWVTIHIEEPFKRILEIPDLIKLFLLIPIGWPAMDRRPGFRHDLENLIHYEKYDASRYMSNEQTFEYLRALRQHTIPQYASSYKAKAGTDSNK